MFSMAAHRRFIISSIVLGLVMFTGTSLEARADTISASPAEITVTASGSVSIIPDTASVSFSLVSSAETADQAQKMNSEAVKEVVNVLKGQGIAEKDLCTTNYSIYAQYDYSENADGKITGYNACTYMTVKNQKIEEIGKTMSACIHAGVNNIDSVTFSCSNNDEAYQQALLQAMKASEVKAKQLAESVGKKLGQTTAVIEGGSASSSRSIPTDNIALAAEETADDAGEPVLLPGEYEVIANVTVTYRME